MTLCVVVLILLLYGFFWYRWSFVSFRKTYICNFDCSLVYMVILQSIILKEIFGYFLKSGIWELKHLKRVLIFSDFFLQFTSLLDKWGGREFGCFEFLSVYLTNFPPGSFVAFGWPVHYRFSLGISWKYGLSTAWHTNHKFWLDPIVQFLSVSWIVLWVTF